MKVFDLVKSCLLEYPTLFSSRIEVFIHLFSCIGNGYEWHNGELVSVGYPDGKKSKKINKMDYSDIDKDIDTVKTELESGKNSCCTELHKAWLVNAQFRKLKRQFIENNIDIVAANIEASLKNDYEVYLGHYMENPCYDYAKIFHIPENITKDYAEAAKEFAKWWRQRLYNKHQGFCYSDNKSKDAKNGYVYIKSEKQCWNEQCKKDWVLASRLLKIINGIDVKLGRQTLTQQQNKISHDIISKILKER